jgi:hypothetical protein
MSSDSWTVLFIGWVLIAPLVVVLAYAKGRIDQKGAEDETGA